MLNFKIDDVHCTSKTLATLRQFGSGSERRVGSSASSMKEIVYFIFNDVELKRVNETNMIPTNNATNSSTA